MIECVRASALLFVISTARVFLGVPCVVGRVFVLFACACVRVVVCVFTRARHTHGLIHCLRELIKRRNVATQLQMP